MISKTLGLFDNTLTADDTYSLLNRDNFLQHIQMQLSKKEKLVPNFFSDFRNLDSILKIKKKKMALITDGFLNLRTPKNVVR